VTRPVRLTRPGIIPVTGIRPGQFTLVPGAASLLYGCIKHFTRVSPTVKYRKTRIRTPSPTQVSTSTRTIFLIFEPKASISVHQYSRKMMIQADQGSKREYRKINSSIFGEFRSSAGFLKDLPFVSAHFSLCLPE
jgi:hypothetical protein